VRYRSDDITRQIIILDVSHWRDVYRS